MENPLFRKIRSRLAHKLDPAAINNAIANLEINGFIRKTHVDGRLTLSFSPIPMKHQSRSPDLRNELISVISKKYEMPKKSSKLIKFQIWRKSLLEENY